MTVAMVGPTPTEGAVFLGNVLHVPADVVQAALNLGGYVMVEDRPGGGAHNDTLRADLTTHNADPSPQPGER